MFPPDENSLRASLGCFSMSGERNATFINVQTCFLLQLANQHTLLFLLSSFFLCLEQLILRLSGSRPSQMTLWPPLSDWSTTKTTTSRCEIERQEVVGQLQNLKNNYYSYSLWLGAWPVDNQDRSYPDGFFTKPSLTLLQNSDAPCR